MTKHFKVNNDVEIDGLVRPAGSFFSREDVQSDEVEAAIADNKIVNVAEDAIPEEASNSSEEASVQEANDDLLSMPKESPKDEDAGSDSSSENKPADEASDESSEG